MPGPGSTRWLAAAIGVALLAFALRAASLDRLLPQRPEPDTFMVGYLVARSQGADPVARDHRAVFYGTLLPDALRWVPERVLLPRPAADAPLERHLAAASRPILVVRLWVAALASLLPLLAFLVARRFLEPWVALLAALLVATSLLHLQFSQQARPHAAHASLAWLALWGLLRQVERPSPATVCTAAVLVFVGVGSFQTGLLLLTPLGVAAWASWRALGRRAWTLVAGVLGFVAAVALFHPALVWTSGSVQLGERGHRIALAELRGAGLRRLLDVLWGCDPALLVLATGGSVLALVGLARVRPRGSRASGLAVLAAYALPLAAVLVLYERTSDRYLLPLLPVVATLAALGVAGLAGPRAWPARWPRVLALALVALAFPSWVSLRFVAIGRAPDTLQQAARWLEARSTAAREPLLVSTALVLPLAVRPESFDEGLRVPRRVFPWLDYQEARALAPGASQWELAMLPYALLPGGSDSSEVAAQHLAARPAGWVVVEDSFLTRQVPMLVAFREVLARDAQRVATFQGETTELAEHDSLDYQDTHLPARRILAASAFGPRIEIYRWEP